MANNELTGKIIQIDLPTGGVSKAGKEWQKQGFVIETNDAYPKKVYLTTMNEKTKELQGKGFGTNVTVLFNVESREYQGKWYTDAQAWKITKIDGQAATPAEPQTQSNPNEQNLPF